MRQAFAYAKPLAKYEREGIAAAVGCAMEMIVDLNNCDVNVGDELSGDSVRVVFCCHIRHSPRHDNRSERRGAAGERAEAQVCQRRIMLSSATSITPIPHSTC